MRFSAPLERHLVRARGCWAWTGPVTDNGHPLVCVNSKRTMAARQVALEVGLDLSASTRVRHACGQRTCLNPTHFLVGGFDASYGDLFPPRFARFVDRTGECWLWTRSPRRKWHPRWWNGTRPEGTHVSAYRFAFGEIPPGQYVCHRCDNPRCVRPSHLFLGTPGENNADCRRKGRSARGERHGRRKLTEERVRALKADAGASKDVAARFGVSVNTVNRIRAGSLWAHVGEA